VYRRSLFQRPCPVRIAPSEAAVRRDSAVHVSLSSDSLVKQPGTVGSPPRIAREAVEAPNRQTADLSSEAGHRISVRSFGGAPSHRGGGAPCEGVYRPPVRALSTPGWRNLTHASPDADVGSDQRKSSLSSHRNHRESLRARAYKACGQSHLLPPRPCCGDDAPMDFTTARAKVRGSAIHRRLRPPCRRTPATFLGRIYRSGASRGTGTCGGLGGRRQWEGSRRANAASHGARLAEPGT
jgi:hypothetical protein